MAAATKRMKKAEPRVPAPDTRQALIEAAIMVVNRVGYKEASVARIAKQARVAYGTFYYHFKNRKVLFDLLPEIYGDRFQNFLRSHVDLRARGVAREMERMNAFIAFFKQNRWGARIINEGATMAPRGYERYRRMVVEGYVRSLKRELERGDLQGFEEAHLPALADWLIGFRVVLSQTYFMPGAQGIVPPVVLETYRRIVSRMLYARGGGS